MSNSTNLKIPEVEWILGRIDLHSDLLHVDPDEGEDEAPVHDAQQVVQEESQAGVQTLGQLPKKN